MTGSWQLDAIVLVASLILYPAGIIVPLWFAIQFPAYRVKIGAIVVFASVILPVFLARNAREPFEFLLPLIVLTFGLILGFGLLVWGFATRQKERHETRPLSRPKYCSRCGKSLSSFPSDIKLCPYCGDRLS